MSLLLELLVNWTNSGGRCSGWLWCDENSTPLPRPCHRRWKHTSGWWRHRQNITYKTTTTLLAPSSLQMAPAHFVSKYVNDGSRAASFKRPFLSVDVCVCVAFVCLSRQIWCYNISETKRFGGSFPTGTL